MTERATGVLHPITDPEAGWELDHGLKVWMAHTDPLDWNDPSAGPFVALEGWDGQVVVIPRRLLAVLARGILAAHVDSARTDRWPPPAGGWSA